MKNLIVKKVIVLIFIYFLSENIFAQWQPDVRLTNEPDISNTSQNNAWCVASSGLFVHVVWCDTRYGDNGEIFYKRSTNAGSSWNSDTRLTNDLAYSVLPSVTVSGSVVHVVWEDNRDGNREIYYKRSSDAGVIWGADTRLMNNSDASFNPSITVSGSVVHVVWFDTRDGNREIYYKRSANGGINWGSDIRLTNNTALSYYPSVSVSGSVVHVVWYDTRDGNYEIYYKFSTDAGLNWGADTRLTNNSASSMNPSVTVSGSVVHVVWYDDRDGNQEIYYKRSTNGGSSWVADTRLTNNSDASNNPSVTVSGSAVHVVWYDDRDGNQEIYYKRSANGGSSWGSDTRLTNNTNNSNNPSVTVSGTVVHVVWEDYRDGNYEIYYKRDPTGNPNEIKTISSEIPMEVSLSQNYPNPFNPKTKIKFSLPLPSKGGVQNARFIVYDALGREVASLIHPLWGGQEGLQPGTYEVDFDGSNYSSGVYYYTLLTEFFKETKRMVLIK